MAHGESGDWAFEDSRSGGRTAVHHGMLLHVFRRNTPQIQATHPSVGGPSRIRSSPNVLTEGTMRVLARHWETPLLRPTIFAQQTRKRAFQFERSLFDATGTDRRHCQSSNGARLNFMRVHFDRISNFFLAVNKPSHGRNTRATPMVPGVCRNGAAVRFPQGQEQVDRFALPLQNMHQQRKQTKS